MTDRTAPTDVYLGVHYTDDQSLWVAATVAGAASGSGYVLAVSDATASVKDVPKAVQAAVQRAEGLADRMHLILSTAASGNLLEGALEGVRGLPRAYRFTPQPCFYDGIRKAVALGGDRFLVASSASPDVSTVLASLGSKVDPFSTDPIAVTCWNGPQTALAAALWPFLDSGDHEGIFDARDMINVKPKTKRDARTLWGQTIRF